MKRDQTAPNRYALIDHEKLKGTEKANLQDIPAPTSPELYPKR